MRRNGMWIGCIALALALAAPAAALAQPPDSTSAGTTTTTETGGATRSGSRTETTHATVTVTAIDKPNRAVTVKNAAGETTTIQVSSDVKEFDSLKVGDKIDVDYTESIALQMMPPGTKRSSTEQAFSVPGGAGRQMTVTAEVVKVDTANNTVTFKGPRGQKQTVNVTDPELQSKLPNLKPGQKMQIVYTESVATSVRPAAK